MKGFVYILTGKKNSVLYSGVTSNLKERIIQHKNKKYPDSFSARYNLNKLVYYEELDSIGEAIKREKQIKGGSRKDKIELINKMNPGWIDLTGILL
ncbi:MAG TPA: GIY-YIG nuclease family protein [Bacteroidales bacterium]|nr:GIY-YIG nuclease family protein [Bacteroidales bacterium]HPM88999.1 GIY-YIG nuclease family protein [Bacteroidales bacterium]HQM70871.1 GIY-YIG nuclease family protein [Bacteroidales bacterium]